MQAKNLWEAWVSYLLKLSFEGFEGVVFSGPLPLPVLLLFPLRHEDLMNEDLARYDHSPQLTWLRSG